MKISEDIHKVMAELQKSVDANGAVDLLYMLREVVKLFERVKMALASTSDEERKDIFVSMAELHAFLLSENKRLAGKSGISEEQLLRFAENPDNFTKEQWHFMQEVKAKMGQQSKEIKTILQSITPPAQEAAPLTKKRGGSKAGGKKSLKKSQMRA